MRNLPGDKAGGLYVHVPFCAQKCEYCAFYSHAASGEVINRYVNGLRAELELLGEHCKPRTIFFGGGTPSVLNLRQWEQVFEAMERLGITGAEEWTVECNPATVSLDKARLLRAHGVNRISMGVQSLDATMLERLGRVHSREMVFKSYDVLRRAGFDNVNIDLMFAIPGQTMEMWKETLREAIQLGSEHLSSYEVIYEEDTPLFAQLQAGQFSVDDDLACDMYEVLVELAGSNGFEQYEIANFARDRLDLRGEAPGRACQHNLNYWSGGDFYGAGPSATEYRDGTRRRNWANTTLYCEQIEKGARAVEWSETLSPVRRAGETAAFGLRRVAGWRFDLFEERTGFDLRTEWANEMEALVSGGFARMDAERFQLTPRGLRMADWAGEQFLRLEEAAEATK